MNAFNSLFYPILLTLTFLLSCVQESVNNNSSDKFLEDHHSPRFKWGYIDKNANLTISNRYDDARDFSNGLAAVNFKGKWGYINQEGKIIIAFNYKEAHPYNGEFMLVKNWDDSWSLIDYSGEDHFKMACGRLFSPKNDISIFQSNGLFGWVDIKTGEQTEAIYSKLYEFKGSYALAKKSEQNYLISLSGEELILTFDRVYEMRNQRYRILQDGKYGFIDSLGNIVVSPIYDLASDYFDNKAFVKSTSGFIIDISGRILHDFKNQNISKHSQGYLLETKDDNLSYLLNYDAQRITDEAYDMIYQPRENYIAVMRNGLWGFLDSNGNKITEIMFPLVWSFQESYARVVVPESGIGFINTKGQIAIEPYFIEVKDFHEGLARVQVYQ